MRLFLCLSVLCILCFITVGQIATHNSQGHAASGPNVPKYLSSGSCAGCHQQEYTAWKGSHHSWALRHATAENVLGDFDGAVFNHKGVQSKFYQRGSKYFIETAGEDGKLQEFEIRYTVGVEPLQQYLVELSGGRLQALDIAWNTKKKLWYHLYPNQDTAAGTGLHWTGSYKSWNARCAECHQTNYQKNYSPREKVYSSRWSELTITCQACHGAGEAHVAWAKDPKTFAAKAWRGVNSKGLVAQLIGASQTTELNLCSKCHSRRGQFGADSPGPKADFNDHYRLALLRPGLYHADGQINDEVYVYGSFLQSKMKQRGVRCTNCHEPHSGQLIAEGNAVCTQCHNPAGREGFPTLAKKSYDSKDHHFHEPGRAGAQCVSCHMPEKNYMIVDPRRDHSFRVPRPDLSVAIGSPNACSTCHADKPTKWAANAVKRWYPSGRSTQPHFGKLFQAHRQQPTQVTRDALLELALDQKQPAIVRASALADAQNALDAQSLSRVQSLLSDKEPLVRAAAVRAMRRAPAVVKARSILPLLSDPKRAVRHAAGISSFNLNIARIGKQVASQIGAARREIRAALSATADFPETHLQIAGLALTQRNLRIADAAFAEALRQDAQLVDAWLMRGRIAVTRRQPEKAVDLLLQGSRANPKSAVVLRALGRSFMRAGRSSEAIKSFNTARSLDGQLAGLALELAQAHFAASKPREAIRILDGILGTKDETPQALELMALSLARTGSFERAAQIARQLETKHPRHRPSPQVRSLMNYGR